MTTAVNKFSFQRSRYVENIPEGKKLLLNPDRVMIDLSDPI